MRKNLQTILATGALILTQSAQSPKAQNTKEDGDISSFYQRSTFMATKSIYEKREIDGQIYLIVPNKLAESNELHFMLGQYDDERKVVMDMDGNFVYDIDKFFIPTKLPDKERVRLRADGTNGISVHLPEIQQGTFSRSYYDESSLAAKIALRKTPIGGELYFTPKIEESQKIELEKENKVILGFYVIPFSSSFLELSTKVTENTLSRDGTARVEKGSATLINRDIYALFGIAREVYEKRKTQEILGEEEKQ